MHHAELKSLRVKKRYRRKQFQADRSYPGSREIRGNGDTIIHCRQSVGESLKDYTRRFVFTMNDLKDCYEEVACAAFRQGLLPGKLADKVIRKKALTFSALLVQVEKQIKVEEYKNGDTIIHCRQSDGESLKDYTSRFVFTMHDLEDCYEEVACAAFRQGLQLGELADKVTRKKALTFDALLVQVEKQIKVEEYKRSSPEQRQLHAPVYHQQQVQSFQPETYISYRPKGPNQMPHRQE